MTTTKTCNGKLGFQIHAASFVLTLALLAAINALTGAPYRVVWVVLGWTPGLLAHWCFAPGARA